MDKDNDILQETIDARIDSFLRGEMTQEEETAFKQEIQADPELRAQVQATVALIRGIRKKNASQEKQIIAKYSKSRVRTILTWACSVAAMFAIFFGVKNELRFRELSAIVSPYYSEYSMTDIARGDIDSVTVTHLYTLFNNIKEQRNVNDIIEELEPIYLTLDSDFTYSAYANDIAWNLALAYIKDDQIDKAIPVLEKIEVDNPDMPIAVRAHKILKEIK